MIQLTPDECRVLGVLVEKELTTPGQYPMSLNAIINGCNQKSNRDPMITIDEDRVVRALDGLRDKKLVIYADTLGSRVMKYKHSANESLGVGVTELVILTEMLLRGPQTVGELRGRASRMHPLESLEVVQNTLAHMMDRPEPLVRPVAGGRATRYAQLLCPELHPLESSSAPAPTEAAPPDPAVAERVDKLEDEVKLLRQAIEKLAQQLGATDIF